MSDTLVAGITVFVIVLYAAVWVLWLVWLNGGDR